MRPFPKFSFAICLLVLVVAFSAVEYTEAQRGGFFQNLGNFFRGGNNNNRNNNNFRQNRGGSRYPQYLDTSDGRYAKFEGPVRGIPRDHGGGRFDAPVRKDGIEETTLDSGQFIIRKRMTQAEAREYCETRGAGGGRLAVLLTPEDATVLVNAVKSYEALWYPGQPDHGKKTQKNETVEHCVVLWNPIFHEKETHTFNDEPCMNKHYPICEDKK
ncbi:unnamed protein product [Orchesella dallaii]|uniref:C-type lectin domain-containing protein n=1 Tax=Orchesella dallaii TaxID=48710 RepID=A0ABP1QAU9_9HEXA